MKKIKKKIFQKPIDKIIKICYNIYTKEREVNKKMKVGKVIKFNYEDVKAITHVREQIFNSMCEALENRCDVCPFNVECSNIEDFFDKAITDKQWLIPERK